MVAIVVEVLTSSTAYSLQSDIRYAIERHQRPPDEIQLQTAASAMAMEFSALLIWK